MPSMNPFYPAAIAAAASYYATRSGQRATLSPAQRWGFKRFLANKGRPDYDIARLSKVVALAHQAHPYSYELWTFRDGGYWSREDSGMETLHEALGVYDWRKKNPPEGSVEAWDELMREGKGQRVYGE